MREGPPQLHNSETRKHFTDASNHEKEEVFDIGSQEGQAALLRAAVSKFATAYKIRHAAGYEYRFSNAVDGNFTLRMQYGQLREALKTVGKKLERHEALTENDVEKVQKRYAAFCRSYDRVVEYALENGLAIPEEAASDEAITSPESSAETATREQMLSEEAAIKEQRRFHIKGDTVMEDPDPTRVSVDTSEATQNSLSALEQAEDAHRLEVTARERRTDSYEEAQAMSKSQTGEELTPAPQNSAKLGVRDMPNVETTNETPRTEQETPTTIEAGISDEEKEAIQTRLAEYKEQLTDIKHKTNPRFLETLPVTELENRLDKVEALLDGSWPEDESVTTHLLKTELPKVEFLFRQVTTEAQEQIDAFTESVGEEMAEVRHMTQQETGTEKSKKQRGWFDPEYRNAQLGDEKATAEAASASTPVEDETSNTIGDYTDPEPMLNRLGYRAYAAEVGNTELQAEDSQSELGGYTDPEPMIKAMSWPNTAGEFASSQTQEADPSTTAESVSEPSAAEGNEGTATEQEASPRLFGMEVPPAGYEGRKKVAVFRDELEWRSQHRLLTGTPKQQATARQVLSVLSTLSPLGTLSTSQRERLVHMAQEMDTPAMESTEPKRSTLFEAAAALPALAEKFNSVTPEVRENFKKRGTQTLKAMAVALALTPTALNKEDQEAVNPPETQTGVGDAAVDNFSTPPTETSPEAVPGATTRPSPSTTPDNLNNPTTQYQQPRVDTETLARPEVDSESETIASLEANIDQALERDTTAPDVSIERDLPKQPSMSQLLDTMYEQPKYEYEFKPGNRINTVSEAMWDTWQKNADMLKVENPVSKTEFLTTMWEVVRDTEKQPQKFAKLLKAMNIDSEDIHLVFTGKGNVIDLAPLYKEMATRLKQT